MHIGEGYVLTMASLSIRDERSADIDAVDNVIKRAFADHPHSRQTEHLIVRDLRFACALVFPKVAILDGKVVGHTTFSRVRLSPEHDGWYGLGPIAVDPAFQRLGIGSALINDGLKSLKGRAAAGCVVLGEPHFYQRFGFVRDPGLTFAEAPPEYFLAYVFSGPMPVAAVAYHPAFSVAA